MVKILARTYLNKHTPTHIQMLSELPIQTNTHPHLLQTYHTHLHTCTSSYTLTQAYLLHRLKQIFILIPNLIYRPRSLQILTNLNFKKLLKIIIFQLNVLSNIWGLKWRIFSCIKSLRISGERLRRISQCLLRLQFYLIKKERLFFH